MAKTPKRPRDPNQLAKMIADLAVGQAADSPPEGERDKNASAAELGRLGGMVGGKARAAKLSPQERTRIARWAAQKRWDKNGRTEGESGGG